MFVISLIIIIVHKLFNINTNIIVIMIIINNNIVLDVNRVASMRSVCVVRIGTAGYFVSFFFFLHLIN